jgi:DNA polymerase-3 subunit delta'
MWQTILGHTEIQARFRRSAAAGRLASTFLFVGPSGIGKRTFALQLAKSLLCETIPEVELNACGACPACQQVEVATHPDLDIVQKPADKSSIPLELFIGDEEHRMREGLCHNISLKPFRGGRKVAIVDDADFLNQEGANCLLKTLEEPPPKSVIILVGTSEQRQLPTIRSRCQIVRFSPLSRQQIEQLLRQTGMADSDDDVRELSGLSNGSLELARQYIDPAVREFRRNWLKYLARVPDNPFAIAKELTAFVDAAGKEAPLRRARLKLVADMARDFFRELLAATQGCEIANGDLTLAEAVADARRQVWDADSPAACLERCIEIDNQVDANANQATLIEAWLDDLGQMRSFQRT